MQNRVHIEPAGLGAEERQTSAEGSGAERFPWIDPTRGYPDSTLVDGVQRVSPIRYVAVRGGGAHKGISWIDAYHSSGLERIDGHDWRLFTIDKEGELEGRSWVWGMFVEGIGAFDVMVPVEWARHLTDAERAYYSGRTMGMYGSHTGNLSYTLNLPTIPPADASRSDVTASEGEVSPGTNS